MKFMNKTLVAVVALFGITSAAFGYDFTFKNSSTKPVAVKLNLALSTAIFDDMAIIQPDKEHTFSFTGFKIGFCLKSISYGVLPAGEYSSFVEAQNYTNVDASHYAAITCRSLTFDITDNYGGGVIVSRRD